MLLFILGLIDLLTGITLLFPNFLAFYIGVIILLKGITSMFGIPTGDIGIVIMGVIDMVAGIMLLTGFSLPWFWLLPTLKGIYSMLAGFG